jgi:hypothetical protein
MWRGDLHPANFASLPLGLWAAVALLGSRLPPGRLALALTLLLVLASLSYQYQWVLAPLLLVLALTRGRRGGPAVAAVLTAVGLYALCTAAIEQVLLRAVGPVTDWGNVAAQPGGMLLDRLAALRSPAQVLELLPSRYYVEELVRSYHPLILAAGLAGLALLGWRPLALGAVGLSISLFSLTYYSAPWAATSSYTLVYAGAGTACAALGSLVGRWAALLPWRGRRAPAVRAALVWGSRLALVVLLVAATNGDLLGERSFLLTWWRYFGGPYLF